MGLCQVCDMNVISDRCPVFSREICTEKVEAFPFSQEKEDDVWDKMGLRFVHLTQTSARIRSCSIKIAERNIFQSVSSLIVLKYFFDKEFCAAIRIKWIQGM